jgi:hypothetical protein
MCNCEVKQEVARGVRNCRSSNEPHVRRECEVHHREPDSKKVTETVDCGARSWWCINNPTRVTNGQFTRDGPTYNYGLETSYNAVSFNIPLVPLALFPVPNGNTDLRGRSCLKPN